MNLQCHEFHICGLGLINFLEIFICIFKFISKPDHNLAFSH